MCKRKFSTDKAYLSLIFIGLLFLNNPVQSARQMALNLFGDHSPDLVTINQLNNMLVQVNNGDGTFGLPTTMGLNFSPTDIDLADFNSDGLNDLVALDANGDLSLSLNNGVTGFLSETLLSLGLELTESVMNFIVGDLDADGHQDIVVAIDGLLNGRVVILYGNGGGGFDPHVDIELGLLSVATTAIYLSDLNVDSKMDIAIKDILGNVHMLLSDGLGDFSLPTSIAGIPLGEIQFADMNQDDVPDMIVLDQLLGLVTIRLGNGDGTFLSGVGVSVGLTPTDLIVVDLNLDGNRDLVTVNLGDEEVGVFIGDGLGGLLELVGGLLEELIGIVPILDTPLTIISADFNQDCRVDIAVWSDITQSYIVQLNQSGPDENELIFCSVFETL